MLNAKANTMKTFKVTYKKIWGNWNTEIITEEVRAFTQMGAAFRVIEKSPVKVVIETVTL